MRKDQHKNINSFNGEKTYLKELFSFVHSIFPDLCVKYFFSLKQKHLWLSDARGENLSIF